uniref:Uncharacterized protein n=1 Tax=Aplanochytrium stocchinoi TaxID=215587 RepID=A0A7S3PQ34_9STRA
MGCNKTIKTKSLATASTSAGALKRDSCPEPGVARQESLLSSQERKMHELSPIKSLSGYENTNISISPDISVEEIEAKEADVKQLTTTVELKCMQDLITYIQSYNTCAKVDPMIIEDAKVNTLVIVEKVIAVQNLINNDSQGDHENRKGVRFCTHDLSCIEPPNENQSESEELSLKSVRELAVAVKSYDKLFELVNSDLDTENLIGVFILDVINLMKFIPESKLILDSLQYVKSGIKWEWEYRDNSPLVFRFKTLLHSLLRYGFRRFFNAPIKRNPRKADINCEAKFEEVSKEQMEAREEHYMRLVPQSGTYEFNYEDVAAVVRVAMECFHDYHTKVEDVVIFGEEQCEKGLLDSEIKSFVEAHKFLTKLLVNNKVVFERNRKDPNCLLLVQEICQLARNMKIRDFIALGPIGNLGRFISTLESQNQLIAAAKGHLDIRKRKTMKRTSLLYGKRKRKRRKKFHWNRVS